MLQELDGPSEDKVSAAISKAFQLPSVKPEQLQVVVSALKRQNLTRWFWEEGLLQWFQLFDLFFPADVPSIVLVVTLLTSILKDQVTSLAV